MGSAGAAQARPVCAHVQAPGWLAHCRVRAALRVPVAYVSFSSGALTTPTATLTELGATLVELPFTFTAVMNGYLESPVTRPSDAPPTFTLRLTGSGRASASFIGLTDETSPNGRSFSLGSFMRYDFVQPQPVPEPGTLFLVGGAIGALAARRSLALRRRDGKNGRRKTGARAVSIGSCG